MIINRSATTCAVFMSAQTVLCMCLVLLVVSSVKGSFSRHRCLFLAQVGLLGSLYYSVFYYIF